MKTLAWMRVLLCGLAVSCAAPALTLYTLTAPPLPAAPIGQPKLVIAVDRIVLPDAFDTENILVRRGNVLATSHLGRWASRLSLGATDFVTARLAQQRPDALVTDRAQSITPSFRLLININRLDVTATGTASLEADWLLIPRDPAAPTVRDRGQFTVTGPTATDQDVVSLVQALLNQLAGAIDMTHLR